MNAEITVDNCRGLLKGEVKDAELVTALVDAFAGLPIKEQFAFAMELRREISFYYGYSFEDAKSGISSFQSLMFDSLLRSFEVYTEISREEYDVLLTDGNLYGIILSLLGNKSFPVDFLIETSWLEKYADHSKGWLLEGYLKGRQATRRFEIMAYFRDIIPNSEHMSDEMIMSIAGITLWF
jgi:hypothetical protein